MPRSQSLCLFPDINVWLAASAAAHIHHSVVSRWFDSLPPEARVCFCRVTQMGLLRLLTSESVMGPEVLTQGEAWKAYDEFLEDDHIEFAPEPAELEIEFRRRSSRPHPTSKTWTDDYLAAFAASGDLTLVTFDQAFRGRVRNLKLLSI